MIDQKMFETLTEKQKTYFKIMRGQNGVLFITAEPGVAKSAIMRAIARKMGLKYFDIRLSMVDEIDVGLFPYREDIEINIGNGSEENIKKVISLMSYAIPKWAWEANQQPSLIHFEELNRAPLAVRNAALQILLERCIGTDFHFNDNVFMCSSGNLGEKDGTDVEEFDRALNNRLIHFQHSLTFDEWVDDFAKDYVHPVIINFLKNNTEHFNQSIDDKKKNNSPAYATPRSWTFLSDFITKNYGQNSAIQEFIDDIRLIGSGVIGDGANSRFLRYLDESLKFGINDIINRYDDLVDELKQLNRDKKSELLNSLKALDIRTFNKKQKENVKKFILTLSEDEAVSYILNILDDKYAVLKTNSDENDLAEEFLSDDRFVKFYDAILQHVPTLD
jgi:hypothetical protein